MNQHIYSELNSRNVSGNNTFNQNSTMKSESTGIRTKVKNKNKLQINQIKKCNIFPTKSILLILLKINFIKLLILILLALIFTYNIIFLRESYHLYRKEINLDNITRIKILVNRCNIYFSQSEKNYNYLTISEFMIINETISINYLQNNYEDHELYYSQRQNDMSSCEINFFFKPDIIFQKPITIRCDIECLFTSSDDTTLSMSDLNLVADSMHLRFFNLSHSHITLSADKLSFQLINSKKNVKIMAKAISCLSYIYNKTDYPLSYTNNNENVDIITNYAFEKNTKNDLGGITYCKTNDINGSCNSSLFLDFSTTNLVARFYTSKNESTDIDKILNNLEIKIIFLEGSDFISSFVNYSDQQNFLLILNIFQFSLLNQSETQLLCTKNLDLLFITKFLRYENLHYENNIEKINLNIEIVTSADQFDLRNISNSQKIQFYQKIWSHLFILLKKNIFHEDFKFIYLNNKLEFNNISVSQQNARIFVPHFFYPFYILFFLTFFFSLYFVKKSKDNLNKLIEKNINDTELSLKINEIRKNNYLLVNMEEILNLKTMTKTKKFENFTDKIKIDNIIYKTNYDYYYSLINLIFNTEVNSLYYFLNAVSFKEKEAESYIASEKIFKIDFNKFYEKYKVFCLKKTYKILEPENPEINSALEKIGYTIEDSINEFDYFITNIKILNFDNSVYFNEMNIFDNNEIFDSLEFFIKKFYQKTMIEENKISFVEFIEVYHHFCERFFIAKKLVDINTLIDKYDFKIIKRFQKYIVQEQILNIENYYFDFFYLNQYLKSPKKMAIKDKTKFFLETLIFKKEEKKISLFAYFLFSLSIILTFFYINDLFFYFMIFFRLENLVFISKNDNIFSRSKLTAFGINFDMDFYLLFICLIFLFIWNLLYALGSFFWLKFAGKNSEKFKNVLSKILQYCFFMGLFVFFNYYIFDCLISIFIYFYLFCFHKFAYCSKFLAFFIKIVFMFYFYFKLQKHRQKYKEIFSQYFEEFKMRIFNNYLQRKISLNIRESEKNNYMNNEFYFTIDTLLSEKKIIIESVLNYSNLDESFLIYLKNYFLMEKNKNLNASHFFKKYFLLLRLENQEIFDFLEKSFKILNDIQNTNQDNKAKLFELIEIFCEIINPRIKKENHSSFLKKNLKKNFTLNSLMDSSFVENSFQFKNPEIEKMFLKPNFLKNINLESDRFIINSSFSKYSKSSRKDSNNSINYLKKILKIFPSKGDNSQISKLSNNYRIRRSKEQSIFKTQKEEDKKKTNFLFLGLLFNIEKLKGKLNLFYKYLDLFYFEFYSKKDRMRINMITFFVRNFFSYDEVFQVYDNINKFNEDILNKFKQSEKSNNLSGLVKLIKCNNDFQFIKNPENFTNYFLNDFGMHSFLNIVMSNTKLEDETKMKFNKKKVEMNLINTNLFKNENIFLNQDVSNYIFTRIFDFDARLVNFFKKVIFYIANPLEFKKFGEIDLYSLFEKNFGNLRFYMRIIGWVSKFKEDAKYVVLEMDFEDEWFFDVKFKNPIFIHYFINLFDYKYHNYMKEVLLKNGIHFFDIYKMMMENENFDLEELYKKYKNFKKKNLKKILSIKEILKEENRDIRYMDMQKFDSCIPKLSKNLKSFFRIFFIIKDIKFKNLKNLKHIYFYLGKLFNIHFFLEDDFKTLNFFLSLRGELSEQILKIEKVSEYINMLYTINMNFKMYLKGLINFTEYLFTKDEKIELEISNLIKQTFNLQVPLNYIKVFLRYLHFIFLKILPVKNRIALKISKKNNIFKDIKNDLFLNNAISQNMMFSYFKYIFRLIRNKKDLQKISKANKNNLLRIFDQLKYESRSKNEDYFEEDFKKLKEYLIRSKQIESLFIFDLFYFFKHNSNIFLKPYNIWFTNLLTKEKLFLNGIFFFLLDFFLRGSAIKLYEFDILLDYMNKNIFVYKKDKNVLRFFNFSFVDNLRISLSGNTPEFNSLNQFINNEKKTEFIQFMLELVNNTKSKVFYKKSRLNNKYFLHKFKLDIVEIFTLFHYIKQKFVLNLALLPKYKNIELDEETKKIATNFNIIENQERFPVDTLTKNFLLNNSSLFKKLNLPTSLSWVCVLFKRREIELANMFLKKYPFSLNDEGIIKIICQFIYLIKIKKKEFVNKNFFNTKFFENEFFIFEKNFLKFLIFKKDLNDYKKFFEFEKKKEINLDKSLISNTNKENEKEIIYLKSFFEFFVLFSMKYIDIFKIEFLYDYFYNNSILKKIKIFKSKKYKLTKEFQELSDYYKERDKYQEEIFNQLISNSKLINSSFYQFFEKDEREFLLKFFLKQTDNLESKEKCNYMINLYLFSYFAKVSGNEKILTNIDILEKKNLLNKNLKYYFTVKSGIFDNEEEIKNFINFLKNQIKSLIENLENHFKDNLKVIDHDHCLLDKSNYTNFFLSVIIAKLRRFNKMTINDLKKNSIEIIVEVDFLIKTIRKHLFLFSNQNLIKSDFYFVCFILLSLKIIIPKELMPIFTTNIIDPISILFIIFKMKKLWNIKLKNIQEIFLLPPSKRIYLKLLLIKQFILKDSTPNNKVKLFKNYVFNTKIDLKLKKHFFDLNDKKIIFPSYYNFNTRAQESVQNFYFLDNLTKLKNRKEKELFYINIENYFFDSTYFKIQIIERNLIKDKLTNLIDIKELYLFFYGNDLTDLNKKMVWVRFFCNYYKLQKMMNIFEISINNFFEFNENLINLSGLSYQTKKYLKLYKYLFSLKDNHSNDRMLNVFNKMKHSLKSDTKSLVFVFEFLLNKDFSNFILFKFLQIKNSFLQNILLIFHQKNYSKTKIIKKLIDKLDISISSLNNIKNILIILSKDQNEKKNMIKKEKYHKSLFLIGKYFVEEKKIENFKVLLSILLKVNDLSNKTENKNSNIEYKKLFHEYLDNIKFFFKIDSLSLKKLNDTLYEKNILNLDIKEEKVKEDLDMININEDIIQINQSFFKTVVDDFDFFFDQNNLRTMKLNSDEKSYYMNNILFLNYFNKKDITNTFVYLKKLKLKTAYCDLLVDFIFQILLCNNFENLENMKSKKNYVYIILYKIISSNKKDFKIKNIFIKKLKNQIMHFNIEELELHLLFQKKNPLLLIKKFFKFPNIQGKAYNFIKRETDKIVLDYFGKVHKTNNEFFDFLNNTLVYVFDKKNSYETFIEEIKFNKEDKKFIDFFLIILDIKYQINHQKFPVVKRYNEDFEFFSFITQNTKKLKFNFLFNKMNAEKIKHLYFPILLLVNQVFNKFINILFFNKKKHYINKTKDEFSEFCLKVLKRIFEDYDLKFEMLNGKKKNICNDNHSDSSGENEIDKESTFRKIINDKTNNLDVDINEEEKIKEKKQKNIRKIMINDLNEKIEEKKISIDLEKLIKTLKKFEMMFLSSELDSFHSFISFFKKFYPDEINDHQLSLSNKLNKKEFFDTFIKLFKKTDNGTIENKQKNTRKFILFLINFIENNIFFGNKILMNPIMFLDNDPTVAEYFLSFLDISDSQKRRLLEVFLECLTFINLKKNNISKIEKNLKKSGKEFAEAHLDIFNIIKEEKIYNILDIIRNFQNLNIYLNNSEILTYLVRNLNLKDKYKFDNYVTLNEVFDEIKNQTLEVIDRNIGYSQGKFSIFLFTFWFLTQFMISTFFSILSSFQNFPFWIAILFQILIYFLIGKLLMRLFFSVVSCSDEKKLSLAQNDIKKLFNYYKIK